MKKIILNLVIAIVAFSPFATFAQTSTAPVTSKPVSSVSPQEKALIKKLGQIKNKNNQIKKNIKINITQSKAQIKKVKKERTKLKKTRSLIIKAKTTTPATTVR